MANSASSTSLSTTVRRHESLSRIATYGLMSVLVIASYALMVTGISLISLGAITPGNPVLAGLLIFLIAMAFDPARRWLQARIDRAFFHHEAVYQDQLLAFGREIENLNDIPAVVDSLKSRVVQLLVPTQCHVFILEHGGGFYRAPADPEGILSSDLRFSTDSPLATALKERNSSLIIDLDKKVPSGWEQEASRLKLLSCQVFIPIYDAQALTGWLALGSKTARGAYSAQEIAFLTSLASLTAQSLGRIQAYNDLQIRMHEMNVISRVAQGVNVTIALDDILELIYAQTSQVIPAQDFFLILHNAKTGTYRYAFYLEKDERFNDRENKPILQEHSLEQDVIRTHQAILTEDYRLECQKRGYSPLIAGIYAWIGVPLNAGAETIGVLCTGSRDPNYFYNLEQMALLQAISDQAAGALVKARLLQETEQRARQLATLNEINRQVSSSLRLEEVLQNMLQHSIEILNCEAGSLLLAEESNGELVFQVIAGPVDTKLVGQPLDADNGVVRKAFNERTPAIVNEKPSPSDWLPGADQAGFSTRALMVIPLVVKDQAIGVIEVINKKDGLPFSDDDQALLGSFASQAAVAIENARLYTSTDQALEARLEELSVMQRIDRELNTSLDISRAMRITLDWAMRRTQTGAGLIGMVEDHGIRIMASQGYSGELEPYENSPIPFEFAPFQNCALLSQPLQMLVADHPSNDGGKTTLLANAQSQVVIPVRREALTLGLILLESTTREPLKDDVLSFLTRLSDHAAIAISNAQLYAAVQTANLAKSEFVSFVSHELKNPMTSIKGYTELIAAKAVGPVNEVQASFLGTIRSNVERMSTLVSDLADVSRIEAGRLRLEFKVFAIHEAFEEVARSVRSQIEEKELAFTVNVPGDLKPVWADRTRIIQVITNLVSNAQKYTPRNGSIHLAAEQCPNQWDPAGAPEVIHVWVQDTGIGLTPEDQKKVFQKFFRSEDAKAREATGTGLGLNITKSLVEMQGGQIWFESAYRQGSTFHITIPVAQQP